MERSSLQKFGTMVFGVVLVAGLILPASRAMGQQSQDAVAQIKATFDSSLAKLLDQRVPLLEALEQQIDESVFDGTLTGHCRNSTVSPSKKQLSHDWHKRTMHRNLQYAYCRTFGQPLASHGDAYVGRCLSYAEPIARP